MKTIAKLWNGEIEPVRYSGVNNREMKQLWNLVQKNFEKLEQSVEEKDLLKKYDACINEYIILTAEQAFCDGFCFGTKLTAEAINGAEEII